MLFPRFEKKEFCWKDSVSEVVKYSFTLLGSFVYFSVIALYQDHVALGCS